MVSFCSAFGCSNEYDPTKSISFHRFPFKRSEMLELWINAVNRENWYPSRTSTLCSEHFLPSDYLIKSGRVTKVLKPGAIPSVFAFPNHVQKKFAVPRRKKCKKVTARDSDNDNEAMDLDLSQPELEANLPSTSESFPKAVGDCATRVILVRPKVHPIAFPKHLRQKMPLSYRKICKKDATCDKNFEAEDFDLTQIKLDANPSASAFASLSKNVVDCATQVTLVDPKVHQVALLKRKIKTIKQKIKRRDLKIAILQDFLDEIRNSCIDNEDLDAVLTNYLEVSFLEDDRTSNSKQNFYHQLLHQGQKDVRAKRNKKTSQYRKLGRGFGKD